MPCSKFCECRFRPRPSLPQFDPAPSTSCVLICKFGYVQRNRRSVIVSPSQNCFRFQIMAGVRVKRNRAPQSGLRHSEGGNKHNAFHPCTGQTTRQKNNIPQHCCKCAPTKRRPTSHLLHRRRRQVRLSRPNRHQKCLNPNRQSSVQQHNFNLRWPIHVY